MSVKVSDNLVNQRKNQYINKTFQDFRNELLIYARSNFSSQINDFSEASLGGMLLDFAAIVGDSLAFYTEQQINELNYETATNTENIISHLRRAGITGGNASPSSAFVTFYIEVDLDPNEENINLLKPNPRLLPIIKKNTRLSSSNNIPFILSEDVDFRSGFKKTVSETDDSGLPLTLILEKKGLCTSGEISTETVSFNSSNQNLFLSYQLNNTNVQKILKVVDNDLNEYYQVDFLSQNTIYKKLELSNENQLYPTAAPFRFILENNFNNNTTLIRFGNGEGKKIEDNILTNPEDLLLPLKHREYDLGKSLDPNTLISSNTLGVSPAGKTLTITYMHGGGTLTNVAAESIDVIEGAIIVLPNISDSDASLDDALEEIESSLDVINEKEAVGGTNRLSLEELKLQIPNSIVSQNRVVNEKDLISRIYTMPSDYGKVHKIAVLQNPFTNLAKDLYVICKSQTGFYVSANDALKKNLKTYINEFRVLGDSFNIIDSPIYNFSIDLTVTVEPNTNIESVLDDVITRIDDNMKFEKLQINEGINVNDIINIVLNTRGVIGLITLPENIIKSKSFQDDFFDGFREINITYSNNMFSPKQEFINGFVFPKRGGIFELKHLDYDIVVRNG
tara:strand:- start:1032 stop:2897 length:1866 start_codon:yes stop_codon:yes gene_type:complete